MLFPSEGGYFALCRRPPKPHRAVDPLQGPPAGASEESGEITAPMHGRLIALFVDEGDAVEEGARLAVVEAMKMEHTLNAPRAGRVSGLSAAVGQTVEQGEKLMAIGEAAAS